ncbi:Calcipressin-domain-containing protein, partial [Protomyces lactucae-debilis]
RKPAAMQIDLSSLSGIREPASATNTLILTNLPADVFNATSLAQLREVIEQACEAPQAIRHWIPLKSFTRIVISFATVDLARNLRASLQETVVSGRQIRIFYAPNMDVCVTNRLEVPPLERNWLISPPGSPPVGWQSAREDPPNVDAFGPALREKLERLPLMVAQADSPATSDWEPEPLSRRRS